MNGAKLKLYNWLISSTGLALLLAFTSAGSREPWLYADRPFLLWITFLVPVACIMVAERYPIRVSFHAKMSVHSALILASLLLYPRPEALIITATGVAAGNLLLRRSYRNIAFNVGQYLIAATAASFFTPNLAEQSLFTSVNLMGAVLGAASFMTLNFALVMTMVSARTGLPFTQQLLVVVKNTWLQYSVLMVIAMLMAVLYRFAPPAVLLMIVPLVLVHRSYTDQVALHEQTKDMIKSLADIIDNRDPYTFAHSRRVAQYSKQIAEHMDLSAEEREAIELAARVHDVGKIGTRMEALMKPGALTDDERKEMQKHPVIGAEIVGKLFHSGGIRELVLFHHRTFDGKGYPMDAGAGAWGNGSEPKVPLGARVIATADAYDAMTSDRPYRKAMSHRQAVEQLKTFSGTQFDPALVELLISVTQREKEIEAGILVPQHEAM